MVDSFRGRVQVYTGDGKGKTTAALGLLVRATGAGRRVYLGQFLKRGLTSELRTLRRRFPEVTVEQFGCGPFIKGPPTPRDIAAAQAGLASVQAAMRSRRFDLVIADEINVAAALGLVTVKDVLGLLAARPPRVELVLTGRGAPPALLRRADLVTEMRAVKHYFDRGVAARRGIET
jgi:cob(I)alamin adenosyltransferase